VGVEDGLGSGVDEFPRLGQHPPGQRQVPEGVNQQDVLAGGDEPGIGLAEAAVRLQPGPGALADPPEAALEPRRLAVKRLVGGTTDELTTL